MRLIFVHHVVEDRGSAQDMFHYARVAESLGHEVVLFGAPGSPSAFNYTMDVSSADAAIFIFEFTTELQHGDLLAWTRLLSRIPRSRRVVIDCDGKYNDVVHVTGDINHSDAELSSKWLEICDSLSDTILQPTYRPLRPNVKPFFFTPTTHPGKYHSISTASNSAWSTSATIGFAGAALSEFFKQWSP